MACAAAAQPANIDLGFEQDGRTTYCQGIQQDQGPLVFETLTATSAGKCPIDVHISAEATTIAPQAPLAVKWSASVHRGDLQTNLFPNAVDPTSKQPQEVIASLLRACKASTNCALPDSVVEPAVFVDDPATDTGAFDANGTKTLRSYQFQFPTAGEDYVIVGKVVLPGDPKLNVSAQEFVAFQRVKVIDLNSTATSTATIRPGNAGEVVSDSDASMLLRSSKGTTQPAAETVRRSPLEGETTSSTSSGERLNMKTVSAVGVTGVVVVLLVVGYAVTSIKHKRKLEALAQGRPTRTFSQSFQPYNSDPEPSAPIRRNLPPPGPTGSSAPTRPSGREPRSSSHPRGGDPGNARPSRQSRRTRPGGVKIPGAGPRSPSTVSRIPSGRGDDTVDRTTPRKTGTRTSQYEPAPSSTRWAPVALPKEIARASQKQRYTNGSSGSSYAHGTPKQSYRASSIGSYYQQQPLRVTRDFSTSSTKSEDYSSDGSAFSHPEGMVLHGGVAIMESTEHNDYSLHRKSSVVLLEFTARDSDLSSLGSLHDSGEDPSPVARVSVAVPLPLRAVPHHPHSTDTRISLRDLSGMGASCGFYRPSSRAASESRMSLAHSAAGGGGVRATIDRSTMGSSGYYNRDTSEFHAPFTERNSESDDWYQL